VLAAGESGYDCRILSYSTTLPTSNPKSLSLIYFPVTFIETFMFDSLTGTLLGYAPAWVWLLLGVTTSITVWTKGNDKENRDQDPIFRILEGVVLTISSLLKIVVGTVKVILEACIEVGQAILAALARLGRYAEENVTIEINLDGTFWRFMILLALIAAGYTTWSTLGL